MTSICEMVGQFNQKRQEEKQIKEDQAANARYWKIPACFNDDDDYNFAITPNEPVDSLIMGDEHLDTVSATELDEFIKFSNDQSLYDEDVPEKIFSNPLFEEEIKTYQHHDNAESDLVESLRTHELTLLKSIPSGIDETDCDPEEDIPFIERLLYDNSSPHPLKEFVSDNLIISITTRS
nr:hypothetical protein [Tanacetum cinerariifolium]